VVSDRSSRYRLPPWTRTHIRPGAGIVSPRSRPSFQDLDRENLDHLIDLAAAEDVIALRPLVDQLQGQWLKRLARVTTLAHRAR
jgi:hypothetical protein